jgi:type I restriction enzyme, S subunit
MRSSFVPMPLASIAHIEMGQSPDSSNVKEGNHGGVPFLQGNAEFGVAHPEPRFSCTAPMKMSNAGDILISVRAPVGAMNIADRDYCIGRGLAAVRVAGMSPTLAAHMVSAAAPALRRVAQGTTFDAISKSDLASLVVMTPPREDREPLARVLDTLDTTIRQTEAIIEKLKQVKQGLLHDLLTRGIDANGELRPPHSQAPHLYKDSPLGWIPREWEATQLRNVGESITGSTPPSADPLAWGAGWPFITPVDVLDDHAVDSAERSVSRRGAAYIRLLPPKATLVVCIGSTIGKVGITSVEACTNQQINALVPYKTMAPEFVHLAVHRNVEQLRAMAGLQAVPIVNKTSFESMLIPVAPLGEQTEIAVRMDAISARIRREDAAADKMRALKSGLMDDLLTGRVRVTPLVAESTTA